MERQQQQQVSVQSSSSSSRAEGPWTVRRLLAWMNGFLTERGVDSPRRTAEILLAETLKVERLKLYMEPDRELDPQELATLRSLVARAGKHEPVQFLVGNWPFFGRDFSVAPCTLIPRPCTEVLVERALAWYRARGAGAVSVLDLCTGTGCIAVSLALGMRAIARPSGAGCRPIRGVAAPTEVVARQDGMVDGSMNASAAGSGVPDVDISVVASDIVPAAVELARTNAARLGATVDLRTGDLWSVLGEGEMFDIVVSNPPYVTDSEYAELDRNVRDYEPASALRGGRDGLDFVRTIVAGARNRIRPGGMLLIEIGWKHGDAARALVSDPVWSGVEVLKDGDGMERVLVATRSGIR